MDLGGQGEVSRSDKLAQEGEIMNMTVPPVVLLSELHTVD